MINPAIEAQSRKLAEEKMWRQIVTEKLAADDLRLIYLSHRVQELEDRQDPAYYQDCDRGDGPSGLKTDTKDNGVKSSSDSLKSW